MINLGIITEIAGALLIPIQVGGGIRSLKTVEKLLRAEVERVILSTAAVEDPGLVQLACRSFQDSIIVALDAREGYLATHGWQRETGVSAIDFAQSMVKLGVRRFIYTDINRDGTLTEPNFSAILASGGPNSAIINVHTVPAKNEPMAAIASATPARPWRAI